MTPNTKFYVAGIAGALIVLGAILLAPHMVKAAEPVKEPYLVMTTATVEGGTTTATAFSCATNEADAKAYALGLYRYPASAKITQNAYGMPGKKCADFVVSGHKVQKAVQAD